MQSRCCACAFCRRCTRNSPDRRTWGPANHSLATGKGLHTASCSASAAARINTSTAVCTESVRKQNSNSRLQDSKLANSATGRCSRSDLEFGSSRSRTRSCSSCPKLRSGAYVFAAYCWIYLVEQARRNQKGLQRSPAKHAPRTTEKESFVNTHLRLSLLAGV